MLIISFSIVFIIELLFKPRLDFTRNKNLLLWYNNLISKERIYFLIY
jgi:hypothetical protein